MKTAFRIIGFPFRLIFVTPAVLILILASLLDTRFLNSIKEAGSFVRG